MPITEEAFLASLKRIERQYGGSRKSRIPGGSPIEQERTTKQPPDEASYNVGKGLARSFLELASVNTPANISKEIQEETISLLADRAVNPALCHGFFYAIAESGGGNDDLDLEDFIAACILFTEQVELQEQNYSSSDYGEDDDCGTSFGPLTCMIRAYANRVRFDCKQEVLSKDPMEGEAPSSSPCIQKISKTYTKLQTQAGRLAMIREFTDVAFARPKQQHHHAPQSLVYTRLLNPILTFSVISPRQTDSSTVESMMCMEGIWRQVDVLIEDASTDNDESSTHLYSLLDVTIWLTDMLDLYLLSITSQKPQQRIVSKELAKRWLAFVLDVGFFVAESLDHDADSEKLRTLFDWFEGILSKTLLRWFSIMPSYRVYMGSLWGSLQKIMDVFASQNPLSLEPTLKLSTMALSHPIKEDVKEILVVLEIAARSTSKLHTITVSMMKGLGSVFSRDPVCASAANYLLKTSTQTKSSSTRVISSKTLKPLGNLIQVFEDGQCIDSILSYLESHENGSFDAESTLSTHQQVGLLMLFGIGLLSSSTAPQRQSIYIFLDKLLLSYPHLGISLLPVVVDSINTCVIRGDSDRMMEEVEFLAGVLVRDPQCAREIWNLLGKEFMKESISITIRSSIVRLFPMICGANKRLYKRVIEAMGNALVNGKESGEENFELRLAVAASTLDLAQSGYIRDPTDVISWLQDFITDTGWIRPISTLHRSEEEHTKESIAYYSILALHSLVIAGELDFKLVLIVLGKKLCDVHNMEEVSMLPPLVLEAVILLLGAGESEEEDSSDEEDNRLKAAGVPPPIARSVETLINLWSHKCLNPERFADATRKYIIIRCKCNILASLTKYSFEALGLDEEGIQSLCVAANNETDDKPRALIESGVRYNALKRVISDGIEIQSILNRSDASFRTLNREIARAFTDSLTAFIGKILSLEEEALGSSLWQKRQSQNSRKNTNAGKKRGSKRTNLFEKLPSPSDVLDNYRENPSQANAIGALLSFNTESTQLLDDLIVDATKSFSDDMAQILYFQAFLNAARSVLRAIIATGSIVESLDELLTRMQERQLDNPDATLMFLAATGALIPATLGTHGDYSSYVKDISNDVLEAYHTRTFEDSDVAKLCLGLLGVCKISLGDRDQTVEIIDSLEKTIVGYGGLSSFGAYFALGVIAQKCAFSGNTKSMEAQSDDIIHLRTRIVLFLLNELTKCMKGTDETIDVLRECIIGRTVKPEDLAMFAELQKSSLKVKRSKISTSRSIFIALGICLPSVVSSTEELLDPIVSFLESFDWATGITFCLHPILQKSCQRNALGARDIEAGDSVSLVSAVASIASIPCLGHGRNDLVTDSPCLLESATQIDIENIVQVVSTVSGDMPTMIRGFLASLTNATMADQGDDSRTSTGLSTDELTGTKLPEAHSGTVSEVAMLALQKFMEERDNVGLAALLLCLEVTGLPNQFSVLVEALAKGEEVVKSASIELLVSQIKGRPRAVFDGRDFVKLASKICKMPTASIAAILGNEGAAEIYIDGFGEMITKFLSQDVELVIGNIFGFCFSEFDQHPSLIITLLQSIKRILHQAKTDKSPRFSPKCLNSINMFLQQKGFSYFSKATTETNEVPPKQIRKMIEAYADCIALVPDTLLAESKIIQTEEHIGFSGECLRIRLLMSLIQSDSHFLLPHSYREITSSIAWVTKQLISSEVGIFSTALLQATCAIVGASSKQAKERRKEIIVSFLDHAVMVDANASFVCLEILAAFAYQFCHGYGSNGDLSLLRGLGPSVEKWVDLPPELLKKTHELAVHDLPYNLARFAHREGLLDIVSNRLWSIYTKWLGQGSSNATLAPLRVSIMCCQDPKNATTTKDFAELVTSLVTSA